MENIAKEVATLHHHSTWKKPLKNAQKTNVSLTIEGQGCDKTKTDRKKELSMRVEAIRF